MTAEHDRNQPGVRKTRRKLFGPDRPQGQWGLAPLLPHLLVDPSSVSLVVLSTQGEYSITLQFYHGLKPCKLLFDSAESATEQYGKIFEALMGYDVFEALREEGAEPQDQALCVDAK